MRGRDDGTIGFHDRQRGREEERERGRDEERKR